MNSIKILLLILVPLSGISQKKEASTIKIYENEQGLKLVTPIGWEHIKDGFSFGNGHVAYVFRLDSNNTFKYVESGCVGDITLDQGTWKIRANKTLVLKSKKRKYNFDIIRFANFLFYIKPEQRAEFVRDLEKERNETAGYQTDGDDPRYTKEFFMAFHLLRKYYGNELINTK